MKENIEGIIIETNEKISKVKINRHGDCCSCGACPGENAMVLSASNIIGAGIGQHVMVEIENRSMLKAAFWVYILPMLMVLAGVVTGRTLAHWMGISATLFSCAGGVLFFVFAVLPLKRADASFRSGREEIKVVKVVD